MPLFSESQLKEPIGWKEVIFGRKASEISARDQNDAEKGEYYSIPVR